jgi:hypothetical protein
MALFCMLVLADRRRRKRAPPSLGLGPDDAPDLARHMVQFALARPTRSGARYDIEFNSSTNEHDSASLRRMGRGISVSIK